MPEIRLGLIFSRIRSDEKRIFSTLKSRGIKVDRIQDQDLSFDLLDPGPWRKYDAIFVRSMSYARGLYAAKILNNWGIPTLNSARAAETCGDKLATAMALQQAGLPQIRTQTAFSPRSALDVIERQGYPAVLKPVVGSWGRLLAKVNDREAAEAVLEHKTTLGSYQHGIQVIQEYIQKPNRDIRAVVIGDQTIAAIYREAEHWITNTARGGRSTNCPVSPELNALCVRAARAVGGGAFGVDVIEDPRRGLVINEVNHNFEFHNTQPVTGVNIAEKLVDYLEELARAKPHEPTHAPSQRR